MGMIGFKLVAILSVIMTGIFVYCLLDDAITTKGLIGAGFFALYFLIFTLSCETDNNIKKINKTDA